MKCRIWKTGVVEARAGEYESFARSVSLPMFQAQDGFRGVTMTRDGGDCMVITYWRDQAAIDALAISPTYQDTVGRIVAQGFLTGDQSVSVHDVHLSDYSDGRSASALT